MKQVLISVIHRHNDARDLRHPTYHMPSDISTWDLRNLEKTTERVLVKYAEIWIRLQELFLRETSTHQPKLTKLSLSPFTTTFLCVFLSMSFFPFGKNQQNDESSMNLWIFSIYYSLYTYIYDDIIYIYHIWSKPSNLGPPWREVTNGPEFQFQPRTLKILRFPTDLRHKNECGLLYKACVPNMGFYTQHPLFHTQELHKSNISYKIYIFIFSNFVCLANMYFSHLQYPHPFIPSWSRLHGELKSQDISESPRTILGKGIGSSNCHWICAGIKQVILGLCFSQNGEQKRQRTVILILLKKRIKGQSWTINLVICSKLSYIHLYIYTCCIWT